MCVFTYPCGCGAPLSTSIRAGTRANEKHTFFFRIASQNRNAPPQQAPTDLATHTTSRDHDTASGSGESEGARGENSGESRGGGRSRPKSPRTREG